MTDPTAAARGGNVERRSPAPLQSAVVDGLAVVRRRHVDTDPALPTVVLVHGAMDRAASFGRVMRRLVEFDVIAYDRRGYANSQREHRSGLFAERDVIGGHAADLANVIVWSQAPHVVVVGHSLGGTVAMKLAAERESDAAGTASLTGLGVFESPAPWLDGSFSDVGRGAIEVADTSGDEDAGEFFYRMMIGENTFSRLRERDREARRSEGPALVAELRALRDPGSAIDLSALSLPVIVGTGATSSASLRRVAELVTRALPDAWGVQIAGAGHGAHLTHPEEFAAYIRACVARGEVLMEQTSGQADE